MELTKNKLLENIQRCEKSINDLKERIKKFESDKVIFKKQLNDLDIRLYNIRVYKNLELMASDNIEYNSNSIEENMKFYSKILNNSKDNVVEHTICNNSYSTSYTGFINRYSIQFEEIKNK